MITTSYGTWNNHGDRSNLTVEATIADFINSGDADWRERMETSGALTAMADEYRNAVSAALPGELWLSGNEFYGPHHTDPAFAELPADLNLSGYIEQIDITGILARHDVDA